MKSRYKKLDALYKQIPEVECKGLCHESCTIVPASKLERKRVKDHLGKDIFRPTTDPDGLHSKLIEIVQEGKVKDCAALKEGRCTIYSIRPAICRIFGAATNLECPYGCKAKEPMSVSDGFALIKKIDDLCK